jgi:hypothetical protein
MNKFIAILAFFLITFASCTHQEMVLDSLKPLLNDNILDAAEIVDLKERYGKEKCAL